MTRVLSQSEFAAQLPDAIRQIGADTLLIQDESRQVVAAVVSPEDYELIRRVRAEDAIRAMAEFGAMLQTRATSAEIDELEQALDRKA